MPTATQLRSDVATLTEQATRDISLVLTQVRTSQEAAAALRDVLPALVVEYGVAAATVAAEWYEDMRLEVGARGRFRPIVAMPPFSTGSDELVNWAASQARQPGAFEALVVGGTQRRIADFARRTITGSSVQDPETDGWQRVGDGACAFCAMLIGRGSVYSESTVDFASHDNCNCSATPAWTNEPRPVKAYTPTSRNITDRDRARVREYLRNN